MNRILNKVLHYNGVTHTVERDSGITLHVDVQEEDYYLETAPEFDMERLLEFQRIMECMGLAIIEEEPPVEMEDGSQRHYFEQRYFPQERVLSVAM